VLRLFHPASLVLAVVFEAATVFVATRDVSILVVYAGICLTTGTLVLGWNDREFQRRRR